MNNVKTLKLKKMLNLKEYLTKKRKQDNQYEEYMQRSIQLGLEDLKAGRGEPIEKLYYEIEREFGWLHEE